MTMRQETKDKYLRVARILHERLSSPANIDYRDFTREHRINSNFCSDLEACGFITRRRDLTYWIGQEPTLLRLQPMFDIQTQRNATLLANRAAKRQGADTSPSQQPLDLVPKADPVPPSVDLETLQAQLAKLTTQYAKLEARVSYLEQLAVRDRVA